MPMPSVRQCVPPLPRPQAAGFRKVRDDIERRDCQRQLGDAGCGRCRCCSCSAAGVLQHAVQCWTTVKCILPSHNALAGRSMTARRGRFRGAHGLLGARAAQRQRPREKSRPSAASAAQALWPTIQSKGNSTAGRPHLLVVETGPGVVFRSSSRKSLGCHLLRTPRAGSRNVKVDGRSG